jgi:hypothetical protein
LPEANRVWWLKSGKLATKVGNLYRALGEEDLQGLVNLSKMGYSNEEVASKLRVPVEAVELVLRVVGG